MDKIFEIVFIDSLHGLVHVEVLLS
jgi:hypothetical protein